MNVPSIDFDAISALRPKSILDVVPRECFVELGQPGYEHIGNGNCYEWKYAIAKWLQPKRILEIGVRYGYSMCSFIAGSDSLEWFIGWDSEIYKSHSNDEAIKAAGLLTRSNQVVCIQKRDSQHTTKLDCRFDLVHIDSSHTFTGCLHDLWLCAGHTRAILVDDTLTCPDDMKAVKKFCLEPFVQDVLHIPSHVGESLIILK